MLRLPSPIGFGAAGLSKINFFYYGCWRECRVRRAVAVQLLCDRHSRMGVPENKDAEGPCHCMVQGTMAHSVNPSGL